MQALTRLHKNRFSSFITAMHLLQLSCNKELIPLKKVKNNTLTSHSPDRTNPGRNFAQNPILLPVIYFRDIYL